MTLAIMSYYFVVSGWTLGYAIDAVRGALKPFDEFTAGFASLWLYLLVGILVLAVLIRGVGGIGRTSKFLLPLLLLTVGGLAIHSQTLAGAGEALDFYLNFDLETFLEPRTWQMAGGGQAFYSLSIGQGFIITYASYIPRGVNIVHGCGCNELGHLAHRRAHGVPRCVLLWHSAGYGKPAILHGFPRDLW